MSKLCAKKLYIYFGTAAEYIKLIPVIRRLREDKIPYRIVLSGQTDVVLSEFTSLVGEQKAYKTFEGKSRKSSAFGFALWTTKTMIKSLIWGVNELKDRNSVLLVQGDTVTALIGAITAKIYSVKLLHVEAGLRTNNLLEPFPEEISRTLIGYLADYNFCPNREVFKNIGNKGSKKISTGYNTSVESMSLALKLRRRPKGIKIKSGQKYFIFIVHRQEHLYIKKQETKLLIEHVISISSTNLKCVFIIHDVTKKFLIDTGLWERLVKNINVILQPRLPYIDFLNLFSKCEFAISDGGGNQTEAHFLGIPCLIFRKKSEQTEGLKENIVLGKQNKRTITNFFRNYKKYKKSKKSIKKWPSEIIVEELIKNVL